MNVRKKQTNRKKKTVVSAEESMGDLKTFLERYHFGQHQLGLKIRKEMCLEYKVGLCIPPCFKLHFYY